MTFTVFLIIFFHFLPKNLLCWFLNSRLYQMNRWTSPARPRMRRWSLRCCRPRQSCRSSCCPSPRPCTLSTVSGTETTNATEDIVHDVLQGEISQCSKTFLWKVLNCETFFFIFKNPSSTFYYTLTFCFSICCYSNTWTYSFIFELNCTNIRKVESNKHIPS